MSGIPTFDTTHPIKGKYDQTILNEAIPPVKSTELYGGKELTSDELRDELWASWDDQQNQMKVLRRDFAPGQNDYNDDYNQYN